MIYTLATAEELMAELGIVSCGRYLLWICPRQMIRPHRQSLRMGPEISTD